MKPYPAIPSTSLFIFTLILIGYSSHSHSAESGSRAKKNPKAFPEYTEVILLGGSTTSTTVTDLTESFATALANLAGHNLAKHEIGDAGFEIEFIPGRSTDLPDSDGLGPVFNNVSCEACHLGDGRGSPPVNDGSSRYERMTDNESLFLRISIENRNTRQCRERVDLTALNNYCAPTPVPGFFNQLFHVGVPDLRPNGSGDPTYSGLANVYYKYTSRVVRYADGSRITLVRPMFEIRNPYDAPNETSSTRRPTSALLQGNVRTSPRIGMPVFGLGLLEAIKETDILKLTDPNDRNRDGISGRANYVFDRIKAAAGDPYPVSLGRFGWKANNPNIAAQSLGAFSGDIGITNHLFPGESINTSLLLDEYMTRTGMAYEEREVSDELADAVTFYMQTLHVPARRNVDNPTVKQGAKIFNDIGCTSCHHPSFITGIHPDGITELDNQTIYPFTDMLLHDMGEELADNRQDFLATGREWKTRPLWGIGLTQNVNSFAGFLHDGRARTIEEAVLWHGGEAEASRERFRTMETRNRRALLDFLNSL